MSKNEDPTTNGSTTSAPMHKKAAFYVAKGVRSLGNHRFSVNVDWEKYYRQASESAVGKGASNVWDTTKRKTNDGVRWARSYSDDVSGQGIEHRQGESFLRTQHDMRDRIRRGDILEIDGESFMVSKDPKDELTATQIPLRSPKSGVRPGIRQGENAKSTNFKRIGDRFSEVSTATTTRLSKVGDAALAAGGAAGGAVRAAGDAAIAAAAFSVKKASDLHDKARYYEQPIGTLSSFKNGASVVTMINEDDNEQVNQSQNNENKDIQGLPIEVPDCLVSMKSGLNSFETTSSLVTILERGDHVMIGDEHYAIASSLLRRLTDNQIPVETVREGESVELVPLFHVNFFRGCVDTKFKASMKHGMNTIDIHGTNLPVFKRGQFLVLGGERFNIIQDSYRNAKISVDKEKVGPTIDHETLWHQNFSLNGKYLDCLVSLNRDGTIATTSTSLLGQVKRGDVVYIGGEEYRVSLNPLKRFTSDSLPLDRPRIGICVHQVPLYLQTDSENDRGNSMAKRKLKRGDRIRIKNETFMISNDSSRIFSETELPLATLDGSEIAYNTTGHDIENEPIYYIGDRIADAAERTSVVAHLAGSYKESVGQCQLLLSGTNQLYTEGDMRRVLKKGSKITLGGETFTISHEGEYTSECITLDRIYNGQTLSKENRPIGNIKAEKFERGSRICYVSMDPTSFIERGDHLVIGNEEYIVSRNEKDLLNVNCVTFEKARTEPSILSTEAIIVEDCLISLDTGSRNAITTSNITKRFNRGDSIMIGKNIYTISTNKLRRFTASTVPLEQINIGESIELEELEIPGYTDDRRIYHKKSDDINIYRHGDRLDEIKKDKKKWEHHERRVWKAREENAKEKFDDLKNKTNDKLDDVQDNLSRKQQKFIDFAQPKAEMVVGAAYVTGQKIGKTMEPGFRSAGHALDSTSQKIQQSASNGMEKIQPKVEDVSDRMERHMKRMTKATGTVLKDLKDGTEDGINAGSGPIKRHELNIKGKVYGGTKK